MTNLDDWWMEQARIEEASLRYTADLPPRDDRERDFYRSWAERDAADPQARRMTPRMWLTCGARHLNSCGTSPPRRSPPRGKPAPSRPTGSRSQSSRLLRRPSWKRGPDGGMVQQASASAVQSVPPTRRSCGGRKEPSRGTKPKPSDSEELDSQYSWDETPQEEPGPPALGTRGVERGGTGGLRAADGGDRPAPGVTRGDPGRGGGAADGAGWAGVVGGLRRSPGRHVRAVLRRRGTEGGHVGVRSGPGSRAGGTGRAVGPGSRAGRRPSREHGRDSRR